MGRALSSPLEWLLTLAASGGFAQLLGEAGSLPTAAWHLARAKCATREHATPIPSAAEVRGAAREILAKLGHGVEVPSLRALAQECEAAGLPVM